MAAERTIRGGAAPAFVVIASLAFLRWTPPVGDYWAARARESAALHGVGLTYWFSWFGGLVPGHYSLLAPFVSRVVDAGVLGAGSTVAAMLVTHRLVRGSAHPSAATWAAAVAAAFNLWSGRVPFALGTAIMVLTLLALRHRRAALAPALALVTAAISPLCGVFLILGLAGVAVHDPSRRRTALTAAAVVIACLLAVELYFGVPGPEGFEPLQVGSALAALLLALAVRPAPYVRTVVLLALAGLPLVVFVPNGIGSNFERLTWIYLPVAALATASARITRAALACGIAIVFGVIGSLHDLYVAAQPMSHPQYLAGLVAAVDRLPQVDDHRLEIVPDGAHVAAFEMLGHVQLARGYETQADHALDPALFSARLDATAFRRWLDDDAVGWVALDRRTLLGGAENALVRHHRPSYLHLVWSDSHWLLFAVAGSTPIVARPGRVVDADQAQLTVDVPAGRTPLRLRWSRLLTARGPGTARLRPDRQGWTELITEQAGRYVLG